MSEFLPNRVLWKTHEINLERPVFLVQNIGLNIFPDPHIVGILEHQPEREAGLPLFFERLKIC